MLQPEEEEEVEPPVCALCVLVFAYTCMYCMCVHLLTCLCTGVHTGAGVKVIKREETQTVIWNRQWRQRGRKKQRENTAITEHCRYAVVLTYFFPSSPYQSSCCCLFQCVIQTWRELDIQVDKGRKRYVAGVRKTNKDRNRQTNHREREIERWWQTVEERSEREERYKWKACNSPARWQLWQYSACSDGGLAIWRIASRLSHRCRYKQCNNFADVYVLHDFLWHWCVSQHMVIKI